MNALTPPSATGFGGELAAFRAEMARLPLSHPRVLGWWMLRAAAVALLPCLCLQPPGANICMGVAAAGWLLCRAPFFRAPGLLAGLAFAAWVLISARWAVMHGRPVRFGSLGVVYTWSSVLVVQVGLSDPRALRIGAWALSLMVLPTALVAVIQFFVGAGGSNPLHINPEGPTYASVGFHDVHLCFGYVLSLVWMALIAMQVRGLTPHALSIAASVAALLSLFAAQARLAFLAAAAGVATAFALRGRIIRAIAAGGAVMLVAVGAMLLFKPDQLRMAAHGHDGRWPIWRTSLAVARDYPVTGAGGPDAFKIAYSERYDANSHGAPNEFPEGAPHAHNSLLSLASRHGLPAVAFYVALIAALVMAAYRRRAECPEGWNLAVAAIVTAAVGGMFEDTATRAMPSFALFTIVGVALALAHTREPEPTAPQAG